MEIRVTLAAMGPIPASLVALVPQSEQVISDETLYGQRISVFTEHDDPEQLLAALRSVAGNVAVGVVSGPIARHSAQLLMMDVDSTLTTTEAIDLLAGHAGVGDEVAEITERAMRGELDFGESLRERVATMEGLPVSVFDDVFPAMTLTPGAVELIAAARQAGARVGVTSGGFTHLVGPLAEQLGLDFSNANQLETAVVDGREVLTGRVVGTIVDRDQKARDLLRFADESGVDPGMAVAVGDGANDLGMFAAAGLSVAYCAKPVTAAAADVAIGFPRLDAVAAFAFRTD
ncbi:phosphoserine phosphatase SerB [Tessaracoccus palaemonis]|uniref:Phosphoserine phosphatase SerB n=1 Tax=Tessaracoccus palaemonis TaxID=2829499 RepID=A0ABX8SKK2_9ACTN|nr:phosphoserine phosphatase SerB [Tessaracoccus palaemonis]QXT62518.1 phosphoserine phosphatase SerB [Tessaracoccus palaemonis]